MKIAVINGTEIKGCTYHIKESFLDVLRQDSQNQMTEFYLPRHSPHFCVGCKNCFFVSEKNCPHQESVLPIWQALVEADLLVFTTPVYALRASGQMKALLDHFSVHWMVHRPDARMFSKKAVILTNAIGVFNGGAQKDIQTSLQWWGISDIKKLGIGLMEGVVWDELSDKNRNNIIAKTQKLAKRYLKPYKARKSIKTRFLFGVTKMMHQAIAQNEEVLSADNQHWLAQGWITIKEK